MIGKYIKIPKISDNRGDLSFVENLPFDIKRIFYLYNCIDKRGGHAHKNFKQFILSISGRFKLKLNNGEKEESHILYTTSLGIYIDNMIWVELEDFSKDAICLVLTSGNYDEYDYIRNYDEFLRLK